jgi:hypothetical protein
MTQWGRVLDRSDPCVLVARRRDPDREFAQRALNRMTIDLNE